MNIEEVTASLWQDFAAQGQTAYCPYAAKFKRWTETLCLSVVEAARQDNARAAVTVNQAKLLLLDKLFEWRSAAPKSHRNRVGTGHICLLDVFDETYRTLRAFELSLTPPLLFLPPPPPARVPRTLSITDIVSFGTDIGGPSSTDT